MKPTKRDYSLLGRDAEAAVANGLAAAEWYHTDVARKEMKALMQRGDGPAIAAFAAPRHYPQFAGAASPLIRA